MKNAEDLSRIELLDGLPPRDDVELRMLFSFVLGYMIECDGVEEFWDALRTGIKDCKIILR